jgi:hypothetical protein
MIFWQQQLWLSLGSYVTLKAVKGIVVGKVTCDPDKR